MKYRFKIISVIVLLLNAYQTTWAQTNHGAWLRLDVRHDIGKHWNLNIDWQYRRINALDNIDFLSQNHLNAARFYINYKINDHHVIGLMPLSFFKIYQQSLSDKIQTSREEIRFAAVHNWILTNGKFQFMLRDMIEYRQLLQNTSKWRFRERLSLRYFNDEHWSIGVSDEQLFNMQNINANNWFDQNRFIVSTIYQMNKYIGFELGYFYQWQQLPNKSNYQQLDNVMLSFLYNF